jgi:hypothetical protein
MLRGRFCASWAITSTDPVIACTSFEEKSGKLPDFFRKIIVAKGIAVLG